MQSLELDKNIKVAQEHIAAGRFLAGAAICEQILSSGQDCAEALYLLALVAYHSGDDQEVAHLVHRAIALAPDDERFIAMLGGYFRNQSMHQEALDCFRRAARVHPDSINALRAQGETLLAMGALSEAEAVYQNVLKAVPDDRAALDDLGEIFLRQGKAADAARHLEQALNLHKEDTIALARLGAALAAQGRREEARRLLLDAVDRAPQQPEAYKTLGDLAHADGCLEEAMEYYQMHLEHKHSLVRLAKKFRTDKWGSHFYAEHYHKHFFPYRRREINLLEIGIGGWNHPLRGGASLRMWKAFFPKGNIFGVDIQDKSAMEEERIRVFQGSQDDDRFMHRVAVNIGNIDIIIDDGSHINRHVIDTFKILFPLLADDGIYVVEDTQTSYWPKFGGTSADLNHPNSMLSFFKGLSDGLNYEELLIPGHSPSYFEQHIVSMHFYHNMVFIYKGENKEGSNFVKDGVLLLE
jgi:tetratricopeptide (TPR) repeat protein